MRRLLSTTVLISALPVIAAAQERTTLLDFLNVDVIVQRLLQTGIMAARTQMDLVYSDFTVDIFNNSASITDFTAWPLPDWDLDGTCEIAIDRISLKSTPFDQPNRLWGKVQISGASFPTSCLPPDVREPFAMAGLEDISIPRLTLDVDYGVPKSDAEVRMHAEIDNVGTLTTSADFTYIWVDARDQYDPLPVIFLEHAIVNFADDGLFEAVKPILPPPFTSAGAGDMIKGLMGEELARENESGALSASQETFLTSLATSWDAFTANPDSLVIETNIDGDIFIDIDLIDESPQEIFDALLPTVSVAAKALSEMVPTDLLKSALSGGASNLAPEDAKSVGLALLSGEGAPRNTTVAMQILEPLAQGGDGDVTAALAETLLASDPEKAYAYALTAGGQGENGMTALLDRIEKELPFAKVLELQEEVVSAEEIDLTALESVARLRSEAAMRYDGKGRARSYAFASLLARLAAAAQKPPISCQTLTRAFRSQAQMQWQFGPMRRPRSQTRQAESGSKWTFQRALVSKRVHLFFMQEQRLSQSGKARLL